jgi:hypothetical protein
MDIGVRKTWARPEVVALVRGDGGEAVLAACKSEIAGVDPNVLAGSCIMGDTVSTCSPCSGALGS